MYFCAQIFFFFFLNFEYFHNFFPHFYKKIQQFLKNALVTLGIETYFWQAPEQYIGNKLVAYGLNIKILTSWHTGRGDTAGTATTGPDIIIEGTNGMIIGCGAERYKAKVNASISVDFLEQDWYHIPNTLFDIDARSFIGERPDFIGKKVSKMEFMQVINSIDRFLIRAKYHTDQLGMISQKDPQ